MSVPLTMILGWVRSRSTSIRPPRLAPVFLGGGPLERLDVEACCDNRRENPHAIA